MKLNDWCNRFMMSFKGKYCCNKYDCWMKNYHKDLVCNSIYHECKSDITLLKTYKIV